MAFLVQHFPLKTQMHWKHESILDHNVQSIPFLVQDFIVEHSKESTHILNAVSPAFTSSFAFAKYIVKEIEKNQYQSNEIYKSYNN